MLNINPLFTHKKQQYTLHKFLEKYHPYLLNIRQKPYSYVKHLFILSLFLFFLFVGFYTSWENTGINNFATIFGFASFFSVFCLINKAYVYLSYLTMRKQILKYIDEISKPENKAEIYKTLNYIKMTKKEEQKFFHELYTKNFTIESIMRFAQAVENQFLQNEKEFSQKVKDGKIQSYEQDITFFEKKKAC